MKNTKTEQLLLVGHGANLTASLRTLLGFNEAHLRKNGGLANASLTIIETDTSKNLLLRLGTILLSKKIIELDLLRQVLFSFYRISVNFLTIYDKMGVS